MKQKILIIEDEEDLVRGLKLNLVDEGYEVEVDEAQLVKLLSARFRRDIHRPNHENESPSEDNPADPDVDPSWQEPSST